MAYAYPKYYMSYADMEWFGIKIPFTKYIIWIALNRNTLIHKPFHIKELH
jgi:hypothetical protein